MNRRRRCELRGSQQEGIEQDEMPESLSGSEIAAHTERNTQELGRPRPFLREEVRDARPQRKGVTMAAWESDRLVVLGGRESRSHGEGDDGVAYPAKET